MAGKKVILIPIYNDWKSLGILLASVRETLGESRLGDFHVQIINDGSTEPVFLAETFPLQIHVLDLPVRVGHQKAIATGMAYIHHHIPCDVVLIMDGDGEDRVEDLVKLSDAAEQEPGKIIFAARASRQEGPLFKLFYIFYKALFRILTGKKIAYGNFMLMPVHSLKRLVHFSEIWNHLPAAIIKSGLPYSSIPTSRGKRYSGKSKMGFTSLLLHGLGAISVFIDRVATRLIIFSMTMILVSITGILTILGIKWFTDLAIPGWASTILISMGILLLQGLLLSLFTIFIYLSSQSNRKFIPAKHYTDFTGDINLN